jgi:hypothetical protein
MEADKILKIQRELDETKIVLHKTIDSVLARGEKLDNLVAGRGHPSPITHHPCPRPPLRHSRCRPSFPDL